LRKSLSEGKAQQEPSHVRPPNGRENAPVGPAAAGHALPLGGGGTAHSTGAERGRRRLAAAPAQVVELRPADRAPALDLHRGDERRIRLERTLHAFAAADLADRERGVEAAIALGDHDPFVGLHALALAFNDVDVDDHGVARREVRDGLAQSRDLLALEGFDDVHRVSPFAAAADAAFVSGRFPACSRAAQGAP
jgi:hypothetical protein